MKTTYIVFTSLFTLLIVFSMSAKAENNSVADNPGVITSSEKQSVQIVTACDGKKRVIVEGYREGEPMPEHKAREVAKLLMALMDFCEQEITARLPKTEMALKLSVNGNPFISVKEIEELPLVLAHGGVPHTEREKRVWTAEMDRLISNGYKVFHDPTLGTNGISCDMCHPDASNTHPETYPKFQTQIKKASLLRDMINWCIENPQEGVKLSGDDPKMKALEAYIISARAGKVLESGKH
ncbi:MAG: c-type cytochrome [Candidatus Scalinduaceae bacterium]